MAIKDKAAALMAAAKAAGSRLYPIVRAFVASMPQGPLKAGFGAGIILCLVAALFFLLTAADKEMPVYQLVQPVPVQQGAAPTTTADGKPLPPVTAHLSMLVMRVGQSRTLTGLVLESLPPAVDLAISPYATDMAATLASATKKGHATWVELAMQSRRTNVDNGPLALSTGNTQEENLKLVDRQVARTAGNVRGVIVPPDAAMPANGQVWASFAYIMVDRGYSIFDATEIPVKSDLYLKKTGAGNDAYFSSDFIVDGNAGAQALDASFAAIEAELKKEPRLTMVLDNPSALAVRKAAAWLATLPAKGVAIEPVRGAASAPPQSAPQTAPAAHNEAPQAATGENAAPAQPAPHDAPAATPAHADEHGAGH